MHSMLSCQQSLQPGGRLSISQFIVLHTTLSGTTSIKRSFLHRTQNFERPIFLFVDCGDLTLHSRRAVISITRQLLSLACYLIGWNQKITAGIHAVILAGMTAWMLAVIPVSGAAA